MKVEFFEGKSRYAEWAKANSDELCAVLVMRVPYGAWLEVDRHMDGVRLEMTDAVVRAVAERWEQELPLLKQRPEFMCCSAPVEEGWLHPELTLECGRRKLDGWKQFLAELLSRPDSWGPYGSEAEDQRQARYRVLANHREESRDSGIVRPEASSNDLLNAIEKNLADIRWWREREKERKENPPRPSPPPPPLPHADLGDLNGVMAMFRATDGKLRSPEIRLQVGDKGILLYENNRHPDRLVVVADQHRRLRTWYGSVSPDGRFEMTRSLTREPEFAATLIAALQRLAANPDAEIGRYGRETGRCIFCGQELIDPRSRAIGFGEICAGNWGMHRHWKRALSAGPDAQAIALRQAGIKFRGRDDEQSSGVI